MAGLSLPIHHAVLSARVGLALLVTCTHPDMPVCSVSVRMSRSVLRSASQVPRCGQGRQARHVEAAGPGPARPLRLRLAGQVRNGQVCSCHWQPVSSGISRTFFQQSCQPECEWPT